MNFEQLKAFLAVAEERSFSKAAKKLYVSQPAISQKIAQLEKQLGHMLIQRSKSHLHLTEHGALLAKEGKELLERVNHVKFKLDHLQQYRGGHLRIACSDTVGAYFIPQPLVEFQKSQPEVLLTSKISVTSSILQSLLEEEIDFGFFLHPEGDPRIESKPVLHYEDVLVYPKDHAFAQKEELQLSEILKERLLLPGTNTKTRKLIEEAIHRKGLELPECQEAGSVGVLKELVKIGMGVGICPGYALSETKNLEFRSLGEGFQRIISVGWRKDRYLSEVDKSFLATLEQA